MKSDLEIPNHISLIKHLFGRFLPHNPFLSLNNFLDPCGLHYLLHTITILIANLPMDDLQGPDVVLGHLQGLHLGQLTVLATRQNLPKPIIATVYTVHALPLTSIR